MESLFLEDSDPVLVNDLAQLRKGQASLGFGVRVLWWLLDGYHITILHLLYTSVGVPCHRREP